MLKNLNDKSLLKKDLLHLLRKSNELFDNQYIISDIFIRGAEGMKQENLSHLSQLMQTQRIMRD